jgi:hypothetical protein
VAGKKGLGLGLTEKAVPKRSEERTDANSPANDQPADGSNREHIHAPGKGAHTEATEVRPRHNPEAEKPRRA